MKRLFCAALLASATWTTFAGAAAAEGKPWMIRGRVIGVMPSESADLSVAGAALGGSVDISDEYVPELDITYFFNKNIAAELILATTQHDVTATNVAAVGGADVKLGDVWVLPPTLTLQYHFDNGGKFKPYVGAFTVAPRAGVKSTVTSLLIQIFLTSALNAQPPGTPSRS